MTKEQAFFLAWVKTHQTEIIDACIPAPHAWALPELEHLCFEDLPTPRTRLMDDTPMVPDYALPENLVTVVIRDGEDNDLYISDNFKDAYFGISTDQHKPPHENVHEYVIDGITIFITFN